MTKSELIKMLKDKYPNLFLKDATNIVDTVFNEVTRALAEGGRVELRDFGSFSTRKRAPRAARNPKTGEIVQLGERQSVYFRAGKELRDKINRS